MYPKASKKGVERVKKKRTGGEFLITEGSSVGVVNQGSRLSENAFTG